MGKRFGSLLDFLNHQTDVLFTFGPDFRSVVGMLSIPDDIPL